MERAKFIERKVCINCQSTALRELSTGQFDENPLLQFIQDDPWGEDPIPFLRGQQWSFVVCQDCGIKFHRYILDSEWNERRFSKWMSQEAIEKFEKSMETPVNNFRRGAEYTSHIIQIEQLTRVQRGSEATRILDFGCGYGSFLSICSMYGFEAVGVDRSLAKLNNSNFTRVFPDIEDVIGMAPFHAITLFEVLEHLDDPRSLMFRLCDLLGKNGVLVVETPDCRGLNSIETKDDYRKIHPLEHINAFTPETLKCFITQLGFEHISKPLSIVTGDFNKIVKGLGKYLLQPMLKPTTQLYFRKI